MAIGALDKKFNIGTLVSRWRRLAGLSQTSLAEAIGVQQATISKIESGAQKLSVEQLLEILCACGLTLSQVACDIEQLAAKEHKPLWERVDE